MARRGKLGTWTGRPKRRCSMCKKRSKDMIDGVHLCRVHSPNRAGFMEGKK